MKTFRLSLLLVALLALFAADTAAAHGGRPFFRSGGAVVHTGGSCCHHFGHFHHRAHVGVFVGVPLFDPWFWGPPAYYPSVVATSPPVYIERGDSGATSAAPASSYWYHCDSPEGYYPYVRECAGGWRRETPQPPVN